MLFLALPAKPFETPKGGQNDKVEKCKWKNGICRRGSFICQLTYRQVIK